MTVQDDNNQNAVTVFQEAMQDVKPLKKKQSKPFHQQILTSRILPKSTYKARRTAATQEKNTKEPGVSDAWVEPIEAEQILNYAQSGVQAAQLKKLQNCAFEVSYVLDLHGYKIDEAKDTMLEFLRFCQYKGFRCVRIIHGKAHRTQDRRLTLKSHVNHWLRQLPHQVLAFCSAPKAEGGAGSMLLLLKKKQT
ncbi:MAG: Smr/MutS family protein [Endozoicomonas sp. (ex Botrylloides leachii)]|nr:Smr/MutS family protein [Endozoicomonas sp. (ex Botrylloides leachii)]